jgi:peptidoglycan/LPS O-acetylase OafA/YrhL
MTDSSIIKKNRNSTIEALKLFLMFGVVVLHICGDQGRAIELSRGGDLQTFRALFICAVDCFMVISGYGVATLVGMIAYTIANFVYNRFVTFR